MLFFILQHVYFLFRDRSNLYRRYSTSGDANQTEANPMEVVFGSASVDDYFLIYFVI